MNAPVQLRLMPLGQVVEVERGRPLRELLFNFGAEFPCGGRGRCKGCRVRVTLGTLPVTEADARWLSPAELEQGWRLACQARVEQDLQLELGQWDAPILSDNSTFVFHPRPGLGIAIDVGTTTLVAQLLDLSTGDVLGVRSALNEQAKHGADIMTRIEFALEPAGQTQLQAILRAQIGRLIHELVANLEKLPGHVAHRPDLQSVVLVGNTVMHHLFCGISVAPLSAFPFHPGDTGLQCFSAADLGWDLAGDRKVFFLPSLGGFVGSDLLAGVLATQLHERPALSVLVDLGTNAEIVLGNQERLLCAAAAAGPAFEGARIYKGMRAASGAIAEVHAIQGRLECRVLGHSPPRGICGSGLVDAVAAALELGLIQSGGRINHGDTLPLAEPVYLTQRDIRELQLAKAAIAAGIGLLTRHWGAAPGDIQHVFLAGAFGNYVDLNSALRIGLFNFPLEKIIPVGNSALLGAKLALFDLPTRAANYCDIINKTSHVSLSELSGFEEAFAASMRFP